MTKHKHIMQVCLHIIRLRSKQALCIKIFPVVFVCYFPSQLDMHDVDKISSVCASTYEKAPNKLNTNERATKHLDTFSGCACVTQRNRI